MRKTLVINLFGGPGVGKSTMCASIFSKLKILGFECEMATEYVKDIVWEESFKKLENQIYIFGKQHARVHRLLNKVDIVITDSPLLNSIVYDQDKNQALKKLVLFEFNKLNSLNFYINRKFKYQESGRVQTLEGALEVDEDYKQLLDDNEINYTEIDPGQVDLVISKIMTSEFVKNEIRRPAHQS